MIEISVYFQPSMCQITDSLLNCNHFSLISPPMIAEMVDIGRLKIDIFAIWAEYMLIVKSTIEYGPSVIGGISRITNAINAPITIDVIE